MSNAYSQYKEGGVLPVLLEKIEEGKAKMIGRAVLLKPITLEMQGTVLAVAGGSGDEEVHEVIAVGPDVEGIVPGQHCLHLDAAAMMVYGSGDDVPAAIVDAKYILAAWPP